MRLSFSWQDGKSGSDGAVSPQWIMEEPISDDDMKFIIEQLIPTFGVRFMLNSETDEAIVSWDNNAHEWYLFEDFGDAVVFLKTELRLEIISRFSYSRLISFG